MLLTKRDDEIRDFLKEVSVADTSTIATLFFNNSTRSAQRRLKQLVDYKFIKRIDRVYLNQEYIYYVNKMTKQLNHKLLFSKFLCELKKLNANILKYKSTFKIENLNIIPDGFVAFEYDSCNYIALVEIELSKSFDLDKYLRVIDTKEFKEVFPVIPLIVLISDRNDIKTSDKLDIVHIKTDFSNIKKIL